jgi:hypothetical protein
MRAVFLVVANILREPAFQVAFVNCNDVIQEITPHSYQIAQATVNGDTPISVGLPATKEHSGHSPELPRAPMLRIKQRECSFGKVALRTSRRKPNLLRTRR